MSLSRGWHALGRRLVALVRRDALDRELDEELRFHIDAQTEAHRRAGLSKGEAERQARLAFGNPLALRETSHDLFAFVRLEGLTGEVRHAARRLRRSPGFTAVALVTLAFGVGANAALLALVDVALLRPLPYPEADRLLSLNEVSRERGETLAVSPANVGDYAVPALESLAAGSDVARDLTGRGSPVTLRGQAVGSRFFDVLRTGPAMGRGFREDEMRKGADKVVVLAHRLWVARFGADPAILGTSVWLDGEPHRVVGVLGEGFRAPREIGNRAPLEFFVPLALPPEVWSNRGDHEVDVVARLRDGATLAEARAQLDTVGELLSHAHPETNRDVRPAVSPLHDTLAGSVRGSLLILLGAVAAALLVACLNLSNLLLVPTLDRGRETAVRVALGAGRAQALRGIVVEAGLLALLGGALGVAVAGGTLRVFVALAPSSVRAAEAALDARVLVVAFGLALVTVFVSALLPARLVSRIRPHESLRSVERSLAGAPALGFSRAVLVAEIAISFVLLVGGGLLVRSLRHLHGVELGFETDQVLVASVKLPERRYPDKAAGLRFYEELSRRVRGLPGVEAVAFATRFPLRGGWTTGVELEGQERPPDQALHETAAQAVSPGYFETLDVPLRQGRLLTDDDRGATPPVAVVNETFARRHFAGHPIGRRFRRGDEAPWVEIVGVVADLHRDGPDATPDPQAYFSAAQTGVYPMPVSELAVRTRRDVRLVARSVEQEVIGLDPDQPVSRVLTLRESLDAGLASRRFAGLLLSALAALAFGLALVGIYGVTSYSVSRRTAELGLRLALGAAPRGLLRLVLGETGRRLALGIGLGLAGAGAVSHLLKGLLFETAPLDPVTFASTAAGLTAAGLVAAGLPAWRASRIDPAAALRSDL